MALQHFDSTVFYELIKAKAPQTEQPVSYQMDENEFAKYFIDLLIEFTGHNGQTAPVVKAGNRYVFKGAELKDGGCTVLEFKRAVELAQTKKPAWVDVLMKQILLKKITSFEEILEFGSIGFAVQIRKSAD